MAHPEGPGPDVYPSLTSFGLFTLREQRGIRLPAGQTDAGCVLVFGGRQPGNEDNDAGSLSGSEKPYCPLYTEGSRRAGPQPAKGAPPARQKTPRIFTQIKIAFFKNCGRMSLH